MIAAFMLKGAFKVTNVIIIILVLLIVAYGIYKSVKHFHGEGECCGGGGYKARKKKLKNVERRVVFSVEGMSCQNCVNRVMEAINSMDGAAAVVHLNKGEVIISMEREIDDSVFKEAIEQLGFTVTGVK